MASASGSIIKLNIEEKKGERGPPWKVPLEILKELHKRPKV